VSDKKVSDMTDDEIRAMAGVRMSRAAVDPDWPATRRAIDASIARARREIGTAVENELYDLGDTGRRKAAAILGVVEECLDDIDQTVPPEEDDE
jgi:hypothetical protein